jgi:hypothetical protein
MQFTVTYASGMYYFLPKINSEIYIFNFGYLTTGQYIYVSKGMRIRGYFSKLAGISEQEGFGNTDLV